MAKACFIGQSGGCRLHRNGSWEIRQGMRGRLMNEKNKAPVSPETLVTHSGRNPSADRGYVNTPVYRGSTILFPTLDALESPEPRFDYGRTGNPSSAAVEQIV